MFKISRHGGKFNDRWKLFGKYKTLADAENQYVILLKKMNRGALKLTNGDTIFKFHRSSKK